MPTTTVRIPQDMKDTLKIIASVEKRNIKDILSELIEEYLGRHRETLKILARPDWIDAIQQGLRASEKGETVRRRENPPGRRNSGHTPKK